MKDEILGWKFYPSIDVGHSAQPEYWEHEETGRVHFGDYPPISHDLSDRITQYLCAGGLFNPEHMEHDKVRTLLLDCRDGFEFLKTQTCKQ